MIACRNTLLIFAFLASSAFAQLPNHDAELLLDYSQWKFAAGDGKLLEPVSMTVKPGFAIELLYMAEKGHLAKHTGAPASCAKELVTQIATRIEVISEVFGWHDAQSPAAGVGTSV